MSDDVLRIVPKDPSWQPDHETAIRVAELVRDTVPLDQSGWVETRFADQSELVDCGPDLERIGCPVCGEEIAWEWFSDEMDHRDPHLPLDRTAPCCGAAITLNDLVFEPPMAFARFTVEIWNPRRIDEVDLGLIGGALGVPVRAVHAHY